MNITFKEDGHLYQDPSDPTKKWTSVTGLIGRYENPFDPVKMSELVSRKRTSKWYRIAPEKIRELWEAENKRSTDLGSWYHAREEKVLYDNGDVKHEGVVLKVVKPTYAGDLKVSGSQIFKDGIYPECILYLNTYLLVGQADKVTVYTGLVDIDDHKTNKKIEMESYVGHDGRSKMMLAPVDHLEDCNFMHYCLQLSLYMFIILQHNPSLKPGKMRLRHVRFAQVGADKFGFPLVAVDDNGNPVVEGVDVYEVPYLYDEVRSMLAHLKGEYNG